MTDVTVKQLADSVGTPVDRLLSHMKEAGLTHKKEDEIVSEEQKKTLLEFLTSLQRDKSDSGNKITLKRKSMGTLKSGQGRTGRNVTVEVRRKRTYVKQGSLQTDSEESSITKKSPAVSQSELEAQRIRDLEETRAKAEEQTRIELEKKKDSLTPADKKVVSDYSETESFHKELNEKVTQNLGFEDNKEFLEFYIYECLSGVTKFNDSIKKARASVCVEFDAKTGAVSKFYKITKDGKKDGLSKIPKISPDVADIASKAKLYAAWKTPKTGPHSSFRVGLTNSYQEIQELPTLRTLIRNEIMNDKIANAVLKEDIYQLDEFAIIRRTVNKLKQIGRSAKMWTTNLISKIAKKVKKTLDTIKKMGSRIFEGLFKFLGIELKSVKQSLPKDVEEFAFGQDA